MPHPVETIIYIALFALASVIVGCSIGARKINFKSALLVWVGTSFVYGLIAVFAFPELFK